MKIPCPACGLPELTPPSGSRNTSHHCGRCQRVFGAEALVSDAKDRKDTLLPRVRRVVEMLQRDGVPQHVIDKWLDEAIKKVSRQMADGSLWKKGASS